MRAVRGRLSGLPPPEDMTWHVKVNATFLSHVISLWLRQRKKTSGRQQFVRKRPRPSCNPKRIIAIQKALKQRFQLTHLFSDSDKLAFKCEYLQTKTRKIPHYFRKLYILFPENRQNVPAIILFREPNNIVCRVKQYSFPLQTLLFRPRKSNLWKMEVKNSEFRSLEDVSCQQIGR